MMDLNKFVFMGHYPALSPYIYNLSVGIRIIHKVRMYDLTRSKYKLNTYWSSPED